MALDVEAELAAKRRCRRAGRGRIRRHGRKRRSRGGHAEEPDIVGKNERKFTEDPVPGDPPGQGGIQCRDFVLPDDVLAPQHVRHGSDACDRGANQPQLDGTSTWPPSSLGSEGHTYSHDAVARLLSRLWTCRTRAAGLGTCREGAIRFQEDGRSFVTKQKLPSPRTDGRRTPSQQHSAQSWVTSWRSSLRRARRQASPPRSANNSSNAGRRTVLRKPRTHRGFCSSANESHDGLTRRGWCLGF